MDLDDLLRHEAGVGRLDSSGQFSVDLEKMRVKLRQYQLAEPGFYVLKLIQGAVAAGSREVAVTLKGGRVHLISDAAPPLTGVLEALALRPSARAARHFAVGLNAAMNVADSVEWTHAGRTLRLTKTEAEVEEATAPDGLVIKKTKSMLVLPASTKSEHGAVRSRCGWSPAEIILDGAPVRSELPPVHLQRWHERLSQPFYLMQHYDLGPGLQVPPVNLGEDARREGGAWVADPPAEAFLTEFSAFRPVDDRRLSCRGAYAIPLALAGPSGVVFILDGVALDPETVPGGPPGAFALVAADELTVDLSEFQLVQDARYLKRVDAVWERWNTMKARIRSGLPQLRGRRAPARMWGGSDGLGRIISGVQSFGETIMAANLDRRLRQEIEQRL